MDSLLPLAKRVGEKLKARKETVGISESSAGGLISAVLLAVPLAALGALLAVYYRGYAQDIYFQIGLLTLVGLSAKNDPDPLLDTRAHRSSAVRR